MKHIAAYLLVSDQGAVSSPPAYLVATLSHLPHPAPRGPLLRKRRGEGSFPVEEGSGRGRS